MRKNNESCHSLCVVISAAAAFMAFLAMLISIAAFIESCKKRHITTTEYDYCEFGEDDDTDSGELAF